jgi:hypothetical protein
MRNGLPQSAASQCLRSDLSLQLYEEVIKGSITSGKLADLVVLADDAFTMAKDKIKESEESATIGGRMMRGDAARESGRAKPRASPSQPHPEIPGWFAS